LPFTVRVPAELVKLLLPLRARVAPAEMVKVPWLEVSVLLF